MTTFAPDWFAAPPFERLFGALGRDKVFLVGGAVRNTLMGRQPGDFDLATPLSPQEVTSLAEAAGLRVIPTGIDHGTVTVIAKGETFEVTTFRADVETDGRRAKVAFGGSLETDAQRRDFTMNAIYADSDGHLIDPVGGMADLAQRRVRFIGDPGRRIAEDYLRILRFFRFTADVSGPEAGIDAEGLAACAEGAEGIETLSAERITVELSKLLRVDNPAPAFGAMVQSGVAGRCLPGAEAAPFAMLVHVEAEAGVAGSWLRRLKATGGEVDRLRLSKKDARHLSRLEELVNAEMSLSEIAYREGAGIATDIALLRASATGAPPVSGTFDQIAAAAEERFPVAAADLMPGLSGPALGAELARLEERWIASGFALSREELMTAR